MSILRAAGSCRILASFAMSRSTRAILFGLFFISGFCALLYQTVWTRLAFASFGIIAPVLSVVLSIFMLGLALGAWLGGRVAASLHKQTGWSPILFYGAAEFIIGVGAFTVPALFHVGEQLLLSAGQMDSARYLFLSALALAMSILPWCLCLGATVPFVMAFVRSESPQNEKSFSFLYLANVLGAMSGTAVTALVLIEVLGFRRTLFVAGFANFGVALVSCMLARRRSRPAQTREMGNVLLPSAPGPPSSDRTIKLILFSTGFCAMAMEVVWVRSFTPILLTQVYAFASILFAYLAATFAGSWWYRHDLKQNRIRALPTLLALCAMAAFLPIILNDARFYWSEPTPPHRILSGLVLLFSICPICAGLGYLTPSLIDRGGRGEPRAAGKLYALNVIGCILGPLLASYILLPSLGERYSLVLLGLPFVLFYFFVSKGASARYRAAIGFASGALAVWSTFFVWDFAALISSKAPVEIRRDYAASVIAEGEDRIKFLLVNGVGMTGLVPTTKYMAHLPLMLHTGKPHNALIICFGMGTSFRSALSWDIETTAVELVPSVRDSFAFYHADAAQVLNDPKAHTVIDDGRRYLKRTEEKYDVIVLDPPPPVAAAGSSLLYSEQFYETAKPHLKPYGILQAWLPATTRLNEQAVLRSIGNSFPHVRCYRSPGNVGIHILASMEPINVFSPQSLALAMPISAAADLMEWTQDRTLAEYIASIMSEPMSLNQALNPNPRIRVTDDRPFNEYFLLRRWGLF